MRSLAFVIRRALLGSAIVLAAPANPALAQDQQSELSQLREEVADLRSRVEREEAVTTIRKIAFSYGYFMDNALLDEVRAMFADDMEYCEVSGYGRYNGRSGCLTVFSKVVGVGLQDENGLVRFGLLSKHYLVKDIIDIAPDGEHASGRFDYLSFGGRYGQPERTRHQVGVYRMGFTKENGTWKISRFSLVFDAIDLDYRNWANAPGVRCPPPHVPPPDAPFSYYHPFPETGVIPYETVNPVTGKRPREYINPQRYWEGNWPGEFGKVCGKRSDAPAPVIHESNVPTRR